MAINEVTMTKGLVTTYTMGTPTTNETISAPSPGTNLLVTVGATTTTITVVRPGNFDAGDAITDFSTGAIVSTNRIINVDRLYQGTTGTVNVQFSQVTNVTAILVRGRTG